MKRYTELRLSGGAMTASEYEMVEFGDANGCMFTHLALRRKGATVPLQPTVETIIKPIPRLSAHYSPQYQHLVMGLSPEDEAAARQQGRRQAYRAVWVGIGYGLLISVPGWIAVGIGGVFAWALFG